jgi:hypothetical protein
MKYGYWLTGMMVVAALFLGNLPSFAGDMTWIITDKCNNPEEIRYRFFTAAEDLTWPAEGYYVTKRLGESYRSTLSCPTGRKICYGAWQSNGNVWGAGSRGVEDCEDCCGFCDGDVYYMTLTCN